MILSDYTIRSLLNDKLIIIDPAPGDAQIQPASVDVNLGPHFLSPYEDHGFISEDLYTLTPGECVLATTAERVEIPPNMVARVEGKSSHGRRFLQIHSTAGFIDPGFRGQITLELTNLSKVSISLVIGEPIAQISFQWVDRRVLRPYGDPELGSHYQDQAGVTPSALP